VPLVLDPPQPSDAPALVGPAAPPPMPPQVPTPPRLVLDQPHPPVAGPAPTPPPSPPQVGPGPLYTGPLDRQGAPTLDPADHKGKDRFVTLPSGAAFESIDGKRWRFAPLHSVGPAREKWMREQEAAVQSPSQILGNLPGIAQIGQAGRAVGGAAQAVGQALGPAAHVAANLPGVAQVGQAARAVVRPFSTAWNAVQSGISYTNAAIERSLTAGRGYETALAAEGVDPKAVQFGAVVLRGSLDVSNVLALPVPISRAAGLGVAAARAAGVAVRASGAPAQVVRIAGLAADLLGEGKLTGPVARRVAAAYHTTADQARAVREAATAATNPYANTPDELRSIVEGYHGSLHTVAGDALGLKQRVLDLVPTLGDRILLTHVLEGTAPEAALPERLRSAYQELAAIRDATTDVAVGNGIIDEGRDFYIRHLYPPEDYAKIKARTVPGVPRPEVVSEEAAAQALASGEAEPGGTLGRRVPTQAERTAREAAIRASLPEEGRRSAYGRQLLPGGSIRGVTLGSQRARTFATLEDAKAAGLHPIEDPAVLLPAHDLSMRLAAASLDFYRKIVALGAPWAGRLEDVNRALAQAPKMTRAVDEATKKGPVALADLIGADAATRHGFDGIWVHPRVAAVVRNVVRSTGTFANEANTLSMALSAANNGLKRIIFLNPAVHGANIVRAAFAEHGLNLLNPRLWDDWLHAADDFWRMGPTTRARLAGGGQLTEGVGRHLMNVLDRIVSTGPAGEALKAGGLDWATIKGVAKQEARQAPKGFRGLAYARSMADQALWDVLDAGFRNLAYEHGIREGLAPERAARFADDVLNRYSKEGYSRLDHVLNQLIFVYAWTRGRAQFFRQMAKAYGPGDSAEQRLWRGIATRWALVSVVAPHLYRAALDRATLGLEGARIPVGERRLPNGAMVPVWMRPSGWFSDLAEFFSDPGTYTSGRLNPALTAMVRTLYAMTTAASEGKNATDEMLRAAAGAVSGFQPAGLEQAVRPGLPWWQRAGAPVGVPPVGAPSGENPRALLQGMLQAGRYAAAGAFVHQNRLPFLTILGEIPTAHRAEFERGYRMAQGSIPGMPSGGRGVPGMPRLP